jgi:hypothetical protein
VIVDRLRSRDLGDRAERVARLRWDGGEFDLRFELPAEWAAPPEDGSPFLAATLQLAMRLGEDLVVDAPVSARLVRTSAEIQQIYAGWDTRLSDLRDPGRGRVARRAARRRVGELLLARSGLDVLGSLRPRAAAVRSPVL